MHFSTTIYAMSTSIDLKRLHHLVLLAEELNFSRAAERACLSQTAFSRSIQTLEAEFGMRLFDRATRSVHPTIVGRSVIERAKGLLARARDMAQEVDYLANADGGTLGFGASLFAVDTVLPGVLSQFKKDRPSLRVDVEVSQWAVLLQHLESESIEFFVAYPGPTTNDPRYTVNMLAPRPASLYCRAEHPLLKAQNSEPRPDQVPDFPWALVQIDNLIEAQLRQLFAVKGDRELPIRLRCDNQALLLESVMSSDAILFTWEAWLEKELAHGSIVDLGARLQPAIPAQARQLSVGVVQLAGRTLSPAARKLISLILEREAAFH
jgi:DNA-binding transcriptional LysR family regulator